MPPLLFVVIQIFVAAAFNFVQHKCDNNAKQAHAKHKGNDLLERNSGKHCLSAAVARRLRCTFKSVCGFIGANLSVCPVPSAW